MPCAISPERIGQPVETATDVFTTQGYRRTQMEDVAKALGVAKGRLYGYVESKAALFDAAVRCADGYEPLPDPAVLPLRTPEPGSTVASVQVRSLEEVSDLGRVLRTARRPWRLEIERDGRKLAVVLG